MRVGRLVRKSVRKNAGYGCCSVRGQMNIRFTSSLTPEDENTIAPALLRAIASLLDLLPIVYAIRIDTSDAKVYQHAGGANASGAAGTEVSARVG